MKIVPVGHRVLVKPDKVEEVSKGGILIAKQVVEKEQLAQATGVVIGHGLDCWKEFEFPWAQIGDRVVYQRYAGMRIPDGKGGFMEDTILLNDLDITGIILEDAQ